ncbi:hypothetical protein CRM22_000545 [Opisthorchis felineus]|uniref:Translation initiation factor eIF2B subunit delta n=1 Tax=Opisthorchis felineus TaxID=147828 RepID=A0A4S2MEI5_OPIFE|nr:hypothetical protein CRM22_000545 [Opisthorchis felineus]
MSEPTCKTKSQLRAERRAIQEAQRAAKTALKDQSVGLKNVRPEAIVGAKTTQLRLPDVPNLTPSCQTVQNVDKLASLADPALDIREEIGESHTKPLVEKYFPHLPVRKQESNRVHLFRHLKEPDKRIDVLSGLGLGSQSPIHPAFLVLGVDLDEGRIRGANERCLHFLTACETLVRAQNPPSPGEQSAVDGSFFARSFGPTLERHVTFLDHCRPLAVTVRNTYQYLKHILNQLDSLEDWEACRSRLLSAIDEFRENSIYLAGVEIAERASASIRPGECVCTFGYSSVVARVLERAWYGSQKVRAARQDTVDSLVLKPTGADCKPVLFSVIVVDSRPYFEGRRMLARLTKAGIPCEYTHIDALPSLVHKVSLAVVGAHALLNNGYVLARIGTAQVANIVASVSHAPTLVCAETYKFWERAHSDAFEYNELGDPDDIWRGPRGVSSDPTEGLPGLGPTGLPTFYTGPNLRDWRSNPKLRLLHLTYDVLPPELVSAVVTEKGTLPTTSVPVVLRVKQAASYSL